MIGFSLWPTYDWVIYFRSRFDRVATSDRRSLNAESWRNSGSISGHLGLGMPYVPGMRSNLVVCHTFTVHTSYQYEICPNCPTWSPLYVLLAYPIFFPHAYLILTWGPTLHVSHLYLIFVIFAAGDLYEVCPIWCDWGGSEALDFKMLTNFKICSSLILVVHPSSSSFLWIKEYTSKCFLTSRSLNLLKKQG